MDLYHPLRRSLPLTGWLVVAWCVMTLTHELGHIVCGLSCGGRLVSFELRPWRLPHSLFAPDPCPLIRLWGGPLLGVLIPLALAWSIRRTAAWLVAHFCTLSNGLYLAAGWASGGRFLDTAELLQHGAHPAAIMLYCIVTISIGYIGFRRHCIAMLLPRSRAATADVGDSTH